MPTIVGYVNCSFVYAAGEDDAPLPDEVIDYHQEIEDAIEALAALDHVGFGLSNSDVHVRDGGEYFADYVWLDVYDQSVLDDLASTVIAAVRRLGIKFNHEFYVHKHFLNGSRPRVVFVRRVYPARNTKWRKLTPREVEKL